MVTMSIGSMTGAGKSSVKVGDLVRMKRGYSTPGLIIKINRGMAETWIQVRWADNATSSELRVDLEVISETR